MKPAFFETPKSFRDWLKKNHASEKELLVGFYKTSSGKRSINWPQSVEEALCFGWIDGVRKSIDEESYTIRFTPRKATSIWSAVNIRKMEELIQKGLMQPAGLAAFKKRKENKSKIYAYENEEAVLNPIFEKRFRANKKAWEFFQAQAPSYKKVAVHQVVRAKQEATRISRFEKLLAASKEGKRLF